MIDYYTGKSLGGNTRKVTIMLAETELEHVVHFVDLDKNEQYETWYRAINPNSKIPAIVDHDVAGGLKLAESGAILVHLAEKTGRFLPTSGARRSQVLQWVFWQASGLSPMAGQWNYFVQHAPQKVDFAIARYRDECARLLQVMETQLAGNEYVVGEFSIADMMLYSWVVPVYRALLALGEPAWTREFVNIPRWMETMLARPAVRTAMTRYEGTALRIGRDVEAPLR
jgi:GST-like protein